MKNDWDKVFPQIKLTITADVTITIMYARPLNAWNGSITPISASMKQPFIIGPKPPFLPPAFAIDVVRDLPINALITIPAMIPIDITNITAPNVAPSEDIAAVISVKPRAAVAICAAISS